MREHRARPPLPFRFWWTKSHDAQDCLPVRPGRRPSADRHPPEVRVDSSVTKLRSPEPASRPEPATTQRRPIARFVLWGGKCLIASASRGLMDVLTGVVAG
jgi:hypothetical protein